MAIEFYTTPTFDKPSRYWGIVLAGGEGKRLKSFIKSEFGKECPKQFCAMVGNRTMFQHTIDRARILIPDEQVFTVVNREHLIYAIDDIKERDPKTVTIIPFSRETAPSLLLPLLSISKNDPDATVIVFPSDHFVLHENLFMEYVSAACEFVESTHDSIVVMGVVPRNLQKGYGWIKKGETLHHIAETDSSREMSIHKVNQFLEKPSESLAQEVFLQGWLVNTMVLVGKVKKFLKLFKEHTPELYAAFLKVRQFLGKRNESKIINEVFESIPMVNFSEEILERISRDLCVMPMNDIYWNDWGEENRVLEDLEKFNRLQKVVATSHSHAEKEHYSIELLLS